MRGCECVLVKSRFVGTVPTPQNMILLDDGSKVAVSEESRGNKMKSNKQKVYEQIRLLSVNRLRLLGTLGEREVLLPSCKD